jgi:hypothetical protein
MKEFMYLFKDQENSQHYKRSPEEMQANMKEWGAWMERLAKAGKLKGGAPLDVGGKTISGRNKVVTDGPFPEAKELVGGYLIVQTADLNEAVELAKGCPGLSDASCNVEVRAIKSMDA